MGKYAQRLRTNNTLRGKKEGFCVICGNLGKLTDNHVPPKGCLQISDVVLQSLTESSSENRQGLIIQGGVKFRTICEHCNSHLLGSLYDPALRLFVNVAIKSIQEVQIQKPVFPMMRILIQPNLVARALIGHLLAAHAVAETFERREILGANDTLRDFLLNPESEFPDDWQIFCWPYLSRNQVIIRHSAIMDISVNDPGKNVSYGHIIKFLPLGFWLIHEKPNSAHVRGFEITPRKNERQDYAEAVLLRLTNLPGLSYPENPGPNSVTLISDEQTSFARPR